MPFKCCIIVQVSFSAYQASFFVCVCVCRVSSKTQLFVSCIFNESMLCLEADMKTTEQKAQRKKAKRERRKEREKQHKEDFFELKAQQYH